MEGTKRHTDIRYRTVLLGPFTHSACMRVSTELHSSALSYKIRVYTHEYNAQHYIRVLVHPSVYSSVLGAVPSKYLLLCTPDVYVVLLRIPLPVVFPHEIFCSSVPTTTLLVLVRAVHHDTLIIYMTSKIEGVRRVHSSSAGVYLMVENTEYAECAYSALSDRLDDDSAMFLMFYPSVLSDIGMFV